MKKYWKLIMATVIICLTFISLNIEAKVPIKKTPDYHIKTVAGDNRLGENIVVDGYITDGNMYTGPSIHSDIRIGQTADEKSSEKVFYKRMSSSFIPTDLERFIRDYKGFMRGKGFASTYTESDRYIAFVDYKYEHGMYNYTELTLDVMNKETKDRSTFDIDVQERLNISDFTLEEITVVGNQAYVIGSYYQYYYDEDDSMMQTENETVDYYLLSLDLEKQEMVDAELLTSIEFDDVYSFYSTSIGLQDEIGKGGTFIGVMKEDYDEGDNEYKEESLSGHYIDATNNRHDINLPEGYERPVALINQSLVFVFNQDGDTVIEYKDPLTGETILSKTFTDISLEGEQIFVSKEQIIYFIGHDSETDIGRKVFALTTDTLELVYEGEIVSKQSEEEAELFTQYIGVKE